MIDYRAKIEAAGISYPIDWDEMGSSEKDLWEERQLVRINKRAARAAALAEAESAVNGGRA